MYTFQKQNKTSCLIWYTFFVFQALKIMTCKEISMRHGNPFLIPSETSIKKAPDRLFFSAEKGRPGACLRVKRRPLAGFSSLFPPQCGKGSGSMIPRPASPAFSLTPTGENQAGLPPGEKPVKQAPFQEKA